MARKKSLPFDRSIVLVVLALLLISVVLISSASVQEAYYATGDSAFYLKRQIVYCVAGLICGFLAASIPSHAWFHAAVPLMMLSLVLLVLVLIIGREVNSATRWIGVGPVNVQPAELLKLFWIIYFASYTCRKIDMVRKGFLNFLKPMLFLTVFAALLLAQPDFGSLVVVTVITYGILFVAGAGLLKYCLVMAFLGCVAVSMIILSPYRMGRLMSFLDPWKDRFGSGYQLTQSLIAFGQGGLTGEGIGNSIQKLSFLPEAHTDFVTAILGEETGFIGVCVVILLEFFLVCKGIRMAVKILRRRVMFQGYAAFGISVMFCLQTVINIGAASGGLPTKGLTLPLISYGGSSLMVCMAAVGILLRIDFEIRTGRLTEPMSNTPVSLSGSPEKQKKHR